MMKIMDYPICGQNQLFYACVDHVIDTDFTKGFLIPKNWYAFIAHVRRGGYASDLKDKHIKKEVNLYQKAADEETQFELKNLRPYNHKIGGEWFANIRMDIESLKDPNARLRG